jgi:hypothetical protein
VSVFTGPINIGGQRLQEGGRKAQEFISLEEEMWFTKSQIRKCERAVIAAIRQPLSGRRLLSGEYMPVFEIPQLRECARKDRRSG